MNIHKLHEFIVFGIINIYFIYLFKHITYRQSVSQNMIIVVNARSSSLIVIWHTMRKTYRGTNTTVK